MKEYMWLIQYLFGLFLGYYVMSPRLRSFTNRLIVNIFKFLFPLKDTKARSQYIRIGKGRIIKPKSVTKPAKLNTKPIELGQSGILVDEAEVKEWLNNNPDLRKANKWDG